MGRTTYTVSTLPFVVDPESVTQNSGRQIDWDNVRRVDYISGTVTTSAEAAATATSIAVTALPVAIPSGTILKFGAGEFALTTAAAAAGATSLTVEALPATIESGDTATYTSVGTGVKKVDAGTVMVELSSGKICPRSSRPASETATGLLASAAHQDSKTDALTGYGMYVGGVFYQNLLPEGTPNSTVKTELNAAGTGFAWEDYENDAD